MQIAVLANDDQWNELCPDETDHTWTRIESLQHITVPAQAYLVLGRHRREDLLNIPQPVLINSVVKTLADLALPPNVCRMNGWNSFISRRQWEVAGKQCAALGPLFKALDREMQEVPDKPGFVAARVLAMIVNEAYFALEENVSSKDEIDKAMKLGTNYPRGPFEWADLAGRPNILQLLEALSTEDDRYRPSSLLQQEASA